MDSKIKNTEEIAVDVCRMQEYLMTRQQHLIDHLKKQNKEIVKIANEVQKENEVMRLKISKLGKLLQRAKARPSLLDIVCSLTDAESRRLFK